MQYDRVLPRKLFNTRQYEKNAPSAYRLSVNKFDVDKRPAKAKSEVFTIEQLQSFRSI